MEEIDTMEQLYQEILADAECFSLKQLAVDGKMLIKAGMKPGKAIGDVLQQMLDYVIEHPEENQAERLLEHFGEQINPVKPQE